MTPRHCRRTATPMSGRPAAQGRPYSLFQEVRNSGRSVKVRTTQIKPTPLAHHLAAMAPQLRRAVWTKCRSVRKFLGGCVRVSRGLSQNSSRLIGNHCRVDSARTQGGKQFPSGVHVCSRQLCTNNYLSIDGRLLLHECATIIHTPSRRHARMYFPRSATDVPLDRRIAAVYRPNSIAKSPAYSTRVVSMRRSS